MLGCRSLTIISASRIATSTLPLNGDLMATLRWVSERRITCTVPKEPSPILNPSNPVLGSSNLERRITWKLGAKKKKIQGKESWTFQIAASLQPRHFEPGEGHACIEV